MRRRTKEDPHYYKKPITYYQPEQKEKFLTYLSESGYPLMDILRTEKTFSVLARTEIELGKDACAFTEDEARLAFGRFLVFGFQKDKFTIINRIRKYVLWCKKTGVENVGDGFLSYTTEKGPYRESKVANPVELAGVVAKLRTLDSTGCGPHFGLCAWMFYAGLTEDQIDRVTPDMIDTDGLYVSFGEEQSFRLEKESIEDLTAVLGDASDKRPLMLPRNTGEVRVPSQWYLLRAQDAAGAAQFDFYPRNVRICGLYYKMWKNETLQNSVLDYAALTAEAERIGFVFRSERGAAEEFREQYERWKCAFHLL